MNNLAKINLAYVIGVALGDGNLSVPNKRTPRLRITCDSKYQALSEQIITSLRFLFPDNKVSVVDGPKSSYFNISIYSNKLTELLPWQAGQGSKFVQNAHVPSWIMANPRFIRACLRGLIQTDGSIYSDRGYKMVNFTNNIKMLADDVKDMIEKLGYQPKVYKTNQRSGNPKYTVRLSRGVDDFVVELALQKK